jgi:hypothetical protein
MASIPATFVGQAFLSGVGVNPQAAVNITLVGELFYSDKGVGGGPMPGQPPGFWGGVSPPMPDHGLPGNQPGIWPTPPGGSYPDQGLPRPPGQIWPNPPGGEAPDHGLPEPPQQPPEGPADDNGFIKPPTEGQDSWAYHETYGWGYFPGDTTAGPKK